MCMSVRFQEYAFPGSVINMKRSTVALAVGLILTAAALKALFPGKSREVIYTVKDTVTPSSVSADMEYAVKDPVVRTINAGEFLNTVNVTASSADLPEAVEAAVETFYAQQEPFVDLALPGDVSYEAVIPVFEYIKPVDAPCSSDFGYRVHPMENLTKFHYGTDLAAQSGDDIFCFADGTVTETGQNDTLGQYIRVNHADGFATLYAHCGTIYVTRGQRVAMGEKIGLVGATGKVTGPNLHFELTKDGIYLNPSFCLAAL